jgi:hypothetical protein
MIVSNTELASRLNELESKVDLMSVRHDTLCSQYPRRIGAAVRGDPAFDGATANCQEAAYGIRNAGEEASQNEDEVI